MKVKIGGGGIDAEGNWFKHPVVEIDVADDFFDQAMVAMQQAPEPQTIPISPMAMEVLREFLPS